MRGVLEGPQFQDYVVSILQNSNIGLCVAVYRSGGHTWSHKAQPEVAFCGPPYNSACGVFLGA